MARHKNTVWNLSDSPNTETAILAALMDIRDELEEINRKLAAGRWQERAAEDAIRRIDKRIAKRIKLR